MYYLSHQNLRILNWVLLGFFMLVTAPVLATDTPVPRSIQVSGTGSVFVAPDKADLVLSVEVQGKTAESARNQAAASTDELIKAVKEMGVAHKDIQTRSLYLYPNYSPDTANKIISYQLSNQLAITIRDIKKASVIIDTAVKAGGNFIRVQGISFAIDNPEPALIQAREKAFAHAKMKAEQYAKLAGITLGSPLHISEGVDISSVPTPLGEARMMKSAMADRADTPVQVGEQTVSITVNVLFGVQ